MANANVHFDRPKVLSSLQDTSSVAPHRDSGNARALEKSGEESGRAKPAHGGVKKHIFAQIAPFYPILECIELASNSANQMRPSAAVFDAPLPSPPLVCCRKPPPVAAGGMFCCCSCPLLPLPAVVVMSPAFSSSHSPPPALLMAHLLALPSLSCVFFLVGARSGRSPAA